MRKKVLVYLNVVLKKRISKYSTGTALQNWRQFVRIRQQYAGGQFPVLCADGWMVQTVPNCRWSNSHLHLALMCFWEFVLQDIFFFFRLGKIENVLFLEHTRVVYIINKLRDSKYIIWSLLEVNHLILNVGELDRKPVVSWPVLCTLHSVCKKIRKISLGNINSFCRWEIDLQKSQSIYFYNFSDFMSTRFLFALFGDYCCLSTRYWALCLIFYILLSSRP